MHKGAQMTASETNSSSTENSLTGRARSGGRRCASRTALRPISSNFPSTRSSGREALAADCTSWHSAVTTEPPGADEHRVQWAEWKRQMRKVRATSTSSTAPTYFCPAYGRGFFPRIGLSSHLRTHQHK